MTTLFILLYTLTLTFLALTERVKKYIHILSLQGLLLFAIAFFQLKHIEWFHISFILVETFIVKAIGIPWFLNRVRKGNNLHRLSHASVSSFFSVIIVTVGILGSFVMGHFVHVDHVQVKFLSVGAASMITGIFFIIAHRSVFNHLIGYMILENGMFLLALAVGTEMPMLVNAAVLLDVVVGALALGLFLNKMKDHFEDFHSDQLSNLKD